MVKDSLTRNKNNESKVSLILFDGIGVEIMKISTIQKTFSQYNNTVKHSTISRLTVKEVKKEWKHLP